MEMPKLLSFDVDILSLDAYLMEAFRLYEIRVFYRINRDQVSEKSITYSIKSAMPELPNLGQITLSSMGNQTICAVHEPDWPTNDEEFRYRVGSNLKGKDLSSEEEYTLTLLKPETGEKRELKSLARKPQMNAWADFASRMDKWLDHFQKSTTTDEGDGTSEIMDDLSVDMDDSSESRDDIVQPSEPWNQIEDHEWDRIAVRMLWEGKSDAEIARKVSDITGEKISPRTITNRLSSLRKELREEGRNVNDIVPTRVELRRKLFAEIYPKNS